MLNYGLLADARDLQDVKMQLEVKTEELKNELQVFMEAALIKLKNMTTAMISEIHMKSQEARQMLNDVKETGANASHLGESVVTGGWGCEAGKPAWLCNEMRYRLH